MVAFHNTVGEEFHALLDVLIPCESIWDSISAKSVCQLCSVRESVSLAGIPVWGCTYRVHLKVESDPSVI